MQVKIEELKATARKALAKYGYDSKETEIILEILMYAQLRGNNQGLVKLIGRGIPKSPEAGEIQVVKETELSVVLDGAKNMGMVAVCELMKRVVDKAKVKGFAIGGTKNTFSSTGAIGYYAREIAKEGLIGFVFAGSPPFIAPHGSFEAMFGTNPMAIGVPCEGEPVVLDMATAAMAYYGLIEANTAGRQIPAGLTFDADGNETTDPGKAMGGAIRPFDKGHKGAGLAMMVEILAGALLGAQYVGIDEQNGWGNLIFVIDPNLVGDQALFKQRVSQMAAKVKTAKRLSGVQEVFVPGERGNKLAAKHLTDGEIDVEDNLYRELEKVAMT